MNKITGIKSIDFKITAEGHGVVNRNGSEPLLIEGGNGKTIDNHSMGKHRGWSPYTGKVSEKGYKFKKTVKDIDLSKNPLYISQNCIKSHLFRDQKNDVHFVQKNKMSLERLLCSVTGMLRGYVIPNTQSHRTSPLIIEDFVEQLGNGNFEQFIQSGERDNTSIFSATTYGDTEYLSYGSINVEELSFVPLSNEFGRAAINLASGEGQALATKMETFINSLSNTTSGSVTFHTNYVRNGTIFDQGEQGLLLDDTAVQLLVDEMLLRLTGLYFKQAQGWVKVTNVLVDYNDGDPMRIKHDEGSIKNRPTTSYAQYVTAVDLESS